MARRYDRDYVPSKRVKAAHRSWKLACGPISLKRFAAFVGVENSRVCCDWLANKIEGGRGAQRYNQDSRLRYR